METWHNLDGSIQQGTTLQLDLNNRALRYGDGFFESMRFSQSYCRLWDLHKERIGKTMALLAMVTVEGFYRRIENEIKRLLDRSGLSEKEARVRLQLYRKGAGLYTPTQNGVGFLIEASELKVGEKRGQKLAFAQSALEGAPSYKGAKTLNALPYVLAAIERKERAVDELILFRENGNLIECTAHNLWWIKDQVVYTTPLETGCVDGVYRRHLLQEIPKQGIQVMQSNIRAAELLQAQEVFMSNAVQGIQWVEELEGVYFGSQLSHYLMESI